MSHSDPHFKRFAVQLEHAIEKYGGVDEITVVERQKKQVETLVALEKKFRKALIRHPWGANVYRDFIKMIVEDRGNILAARPYFRERQDIFTTKISAALRANRPRGLYPFAINYQFVKFVMDSRRWHENRIGGKIVELAEQIATLRTEIVEMNMPLAISRARIFWSRTPRSHLSYMDLVQISCEGLMSAVDKFVLPYSKVFRSVAIGRIVGNFIESYSETMLHFYPQDKRKIYRANKGISKLAFGKSDIIDFEKLAEEVNKDAEQKQHTNANELGNLVAAASHVSAETYEERRDTKPNQPLRRGIDLYAADESTQPDSSFEEREVKSVMRQAYESLSLVERKLLRLKGIEVESLRYIQ